MMINGKTKGLGSIVTWNMTGFVARQEIVDAFTDAGLEDVPIHVSRKKTFVLRAIKDCAKDNLIRLVGEDESKITFVVVDEHTDINNESWRANVEATVTYDKKKDELRGGHDNPFIADIAEALRRNEGGVVAQDVANATKLLLMRKANAIALREMGGVYFVPSTHTRVIDAVEHALSMCKPSRGSFKLNRLDVVANVRAAADVASIVADSLEKQVEQLTKAAFELARDDGVRVKGLDTKRRKIGELLVKAGEYQQLLNADNLIELQTRIRKARGAVFKLWAKKKAKRNNAR